MLKLLLLAAVWVSQLFRRILVNLSICQDFSGVLLAHVTLDLNGSSAGRRPPALGATFPSCKGVLHLQCTASRVPWQSRRDARHGTRHCLWHGQKLHQVLQLRGMLHGLLQQAWSEVGMCHGNARMWHQHSTPCSSAARSQDRLGTLHYCMSAKYVSAAGVECCC